MNIIASLLAWKVFGPLLKLVVAKIMELYTANTIAGGCWVKVRYKGTDGSYIKGTRQMNNYSIHIQKLNNVTTYNYSAGKMFSR